jgi:hypothetical protein
MDKGKGVLTARATSFRSDVIARFGLLPNFFSSAEDAPEMVERLWDFAKAAYIDNPIPSLFKEKGIGLSVARAFARCDTASSGIVLSYLDMGILPAVRWFLDRPLRKSSSS